MPHPARWSRPGKRNPRPGGNPGTPWAARERQRSGLSRRVAVLRVLLVARGTRLWEKNQVRGPFVPRSEAQGRSSCCASAISGIPLSVALEGSVQVSGPLYFLLRINSHFSAPEQPLDSPFSASIHPCRGSPDASFHWANAHPRRRNQGDNSATCYFL